ncbi:hypothetical protein ABZS29_21370 [Kribbella sp. NPDC005582]|uniref:hypothetical protein n=1 Tax=Kribbella sp. NPDC005582 TaxID=3156893 RepID=UPI0033A822E9
MSDGVDQTTVVRTEFARALDISVIAIVGVWHFLYVLPALVVSADAYRLLSLEMLAWTGLTALLVGGAIRTLAGRDTFTSWWRTLSALLATGAVAVAMVPGDQVTGAANWAFGDVVLVGILLLLRERLMAFAILFLGNILINLSAMVILADHVGLTIATRFIVIACAGGALVPTAILLAARALDNAAADAGASISRRTASHAERLTADALHRVRRDRYGSLHSRVEPLLVGLANGSLDPRSADVQHRCAIEAARLRRLFAESDDVPNPLMHELRACASTAECRGVLVELAAVGQLPDLPLGARRTLTEPVIEALASTNAWARLTVFASPDEVVVSVTGDGNHPNEPRHPLWLEARWRHP